MNPNLCRLIEKNSYRLSHWHSQHNGKMFFLGGDWRISSAEANNNFHCHFYGYFISCRIAVLLSLPCCCCCCCSTKRIQAGRPSVCMNVDGHSRRPRRAQEDNMACLLKQQDEEVVGGWGFTIIIYLYNQFINVAFISL